MAKIVRLSIGGRDFTTSLATLQKDPNSMLATMINDCWDLKKICSDQTLFIDRDPTFFIHVLNFLRDGPNFSLPKNEDHLIRIKAEAEFYQLEGLKIMVNKALHKLNSSKTWIPKVGDIVQWKESMVDCFLSLFWGFTNGCYLSPLDSMIIKRKPEESVNVKRFRIIDTGSIYEIKACEYECFACNEPAYFQIKRKTFKQDHWSTSDTEDDDDGVDYQKHKSRFLMNSVQGEIEELLNDTCAVVKWMVKSPIFSTAYINERGHIQKCITRTTKIHIPLSALKPYYVSKRD